MTISHFIVPSVAYPRYNYSQKHVYPLIKRFRNLMELVQLEDVFPVPTFGDVNVYVIHDDSSIKLNKENLTQKKIDGIKCSELPFPLSDDKKEPDEVNVYVASFEQTKDDESILKDMGKYAIFLLSDECGEISSPLCREKGGGMIYTTTVANFPHIITTLLERIVFMSLFERVRVLQCMLELDKPDALFATLDSETKLSFKHLTDTRSLKQYSPMTIQTAIRLWWKARYEALKCVVQSKYTKTPSEFTDQFFRNGVEVSKYLKSQICEAVLPVLRSGLAQTDDLYKPEDVRAFVNEMTNAVYFNRDCDELIGTFKEHAKLVALNRNTIEDIYGEIQGMYYRSRIPVLDKPQNIAKMSEALDEKVARKILRVDGVTGVGYRYKTLSIFLKDTLTEMERSKSENCLRPMLDNEKIARYSFQAEPENIFEFAEVGSTISVKKAGTLGGFARLGESKDLCVLLARHLADQGKPLFLESTTNRNQKILFGHVLEPKNKTERYGTLDIALAQVLRKIRENCKVEFKDEEGISLPSEVFKFDDLNWLCGLPVHIWGANSSPGLGKIVIPVLYMKEMEEKLMKIESRDSGDLHSSRVEFAKEGDSGAVVCTNTPDGEKVTALAMLMGSSLDNEQAGINEKKQYVCFRLINGLNQLQKEQNENIELC